MIHHVVNNESTLRPADFEVSYKFLSSEEGGRRSGLPKQGYRCDWLYSGEDIEGSVVYMIWPEFEDAQGLALPNGTQVFLRGKARMRILNSDLRRTVHRQLLRVGTKGYFVEGRTRVAEAEVVRILALNED